MLNKKSFKKIKNPMSLRGAKQASPCVSRGSNLGGFSLIELMVAVVILVMAIFGIFQAYSVGFMGMADARAVTVATNYAREAMEDIKNMDFGEIEPQVSSPIVINGITYYRQVTVQEKPNMKRVITTVTWKDRNGNTKMVENDMLVHFIETTAGVATRIMLIANPYNILTEDYDDTIGVYENESIIIAVVKDAKGNTVTAYNSEITFSITVGDNYGSLPNNSNTYTVSSIKGIATTTFTASGKGEVIITVSANGLADDSVNIKITDPGDPVKINLTNYVGGTETLFMIPGTVSEITATIVDAGGKKVDDANNEILFEVYSGPGFLSTPTTFPASNGVAKITLTSNAPPGGTITVTASSSGLEPGVVEVITGGQISLSAFPSPVHNEEKSEITVTTKDVDGVPINYIGIIDLSVTSYDGTIGSGNLSPEFVEFNGDTYLQGVTFTAYSEGKVLITAIDERGILDPAEIILIIDPVLIPHHIEVYANPSNIQVGSTDTSTITAKIKDVKNVTMNSYTETITFTTTSTTSGNFPNGLPSIDTSSGHVTYKDGIAKVKFYPPDVSAENATIDVSSTYYDTISSENITIYGSTVVSFHLEGHHILLNAYPSNIKVKGENPDACAITATILDLHGRTVTDYKGKVKFSITSGDAKFALTGSTLITVVNGEAQIILQAGNTPGTVKVKATSSDLLPGRIYIPIINIQLDDSQTTYVNNGLVSFYIKIEGVDDLTTDFILNEMQVSWDPSNGETLYKIEIESPYINGESAVTVFENSTNPASNGELISGINITLSKSKTDASNIKLYFSTNMENKNTLDVTFNANSGEYVVHLK